MDETTLRARRRRGVFADALVGTGATVILLHVATGIGATTASNAWGVALIVVGMALLWGVPQPAFRTRMISGVAGLFFGYALALVVEPGFGLSMRAALRPDDCVMPDAADGEAVVQVCASSADAVAALVALLAGLVVLAAAWWTASREAPRAPQ